MANKIKSTLKALGLVGLLALESGCGLKYNHYEFNGRIDKEDVRFTKKDCQNVLEVKGYDYEVTYIDMLCDGKVDCVFVNSRGASREYSNNLVGREIIQAAQKKYENYLNKILVEKRAVGERVIIGGKK